MNNLTLNYINQLDFSYDYVSKLENNKYILYIYKNETCVKIKANEAPQVDFGLCYEKVKSVNNITGNLIITIITIKSDKDKMAKSSNTYAFSNPETGRVLNSGEICKEEKRGVQEDVMSAIKALDDEKEEFIICLTKQGINVFNISDRFYNDLCYHYESPNGKDIPMKDRIIYCFPNITLCDAGCENKGVDLETMKAKCECIFNDLMNPSLLDNIYGQSIAELIEIFSSFNINVVQCFRDIIVKEYFVKCIGGYFILGLLFGQFICMFKFTCDGLYFIRKHIFSLTKCFMEYLKINPDLIHPPKRQKINSIAINVSQKREGNSFYNSSKMSLNQNNTHKYMKSNANLKKEKLITNKTSSKTINKSISISTSKSSSKLIKLESNNKLKFKLKLKPKKD